MFSKAIEVGREDPVRVRQRNDIPLAVVIRGCKRLACRRSELKMPTGIKIELEPAVGGARRAGEH